MTVYRPTTVEGAREIAARKLELGGPVAVRGGCTLAPAPDIEALSTARLCAERFFHPEDMVIGVEAGTPFTDLHRRLQAEDMILPVAPWFADGTIGGMAAANLFGPERLERGGLRDYIIGIEYLDGFGAIAKAGGRVVKNVTGYDVSRLLLGSRGGLALITALNFKVVPSPREPRVLWGRFADLAWLPRVKSLHAACLPVDWLQAVFLDGGWLLGMGISGNAPRRDRLAASLGEIFGGGLNLSTEGDLPDEAAGFGDGVRYGGFVGYWQRGLGRSCRHVHGLFPTADLMSPPFLEALTALSDRMILHPIGGDFHAFLNAGADDDLTRLKSICNGKDGFLEPVAPDAATRAALGYCHPKPGEYALMQALKRQMDPNGLFYAPFYSM